MFNDRLCCMDWTWRNRAGFRTFTNTWDIRDEPGGATEVGGIGMTQEVYSTRKDWLIICQFLQLSIEWIAISSKSQVLFRTCFPLGLRRVAVNSHPSALPGVWHPLDPTRTLRITMFFSSAEGDNSERVGRIQAAIRNSIFGGFYSSSSPTRFDGARLTSLPL